MNPTRSIEGRAGHAVLKMVVLAFIVCVLMGGIYLALIAATRTVACADNLKRIYGALEIYELSHGALPRMDFYPDEALTSPESMCVVLESYGLESATWICPATHRVIRDTGLSYLWNTRLNGVSLRALPERQWMLVEINAISAEVPRPHLGYCNVLFTDGTVERMKNPAREIAGW